MKTRVPNFLIIIPLQSNTFEMIPCNFFFNSKSICVEISEFLKNPFGNLKGKSSMLVNLSPFLYFGILMTVYNLII